MSQITYLYTIEGTDWFDAIPVMSNFRAIANVINGGLDDDNFNAASAFKVDRIRASSKLEAPLINPDSDIIIEIAEGSYMAILDPSANEVLRIESAGVTLV